MSDAAREPNRRGALDADVDAYVLDGRGTLSEEDKVAGLERLAGRDLRPRVVLLLRGAGEVDPGDVVGGLHELAAVEADAGGLAAPDVRGADLGESPVDGDGG